MPAGVAPKNFKGNKNSGRKSAYDEFNKVNAINKLWEKVNTKIQAGEKLTQYEEKLVLALLPKTIKQNLDLTGKVTIKDLISKYESDSDQDA